MTAALENKHTAKPRLITDYFTSLDYTVSYEKQHKELCLR